MPDDYDFFVSYARADNREGWIERFLEALAEEHRRFTGGRTLTYFFDRQDIRNFSHWGTEIFNKGLTRSRLFLAFLSPRYFASEVCRKEWKAWIDQEIARHILSSGAAPIYIVEVPGFVSRPMLPEHEVARKVAELCGVPAPHDRFTNDLAPIVKELRRRQLSAVQPFYNAGLTALQQADLRQVLRRLAEDLDRRVEEAERADQSASTVPPYNRKFSGRLDELIELRRKLTDNRAGVISGIHGLGGIGKTELRRHNHEKRLQAVLGPTLAELSPEERRAMEYAALLPPDLVPLPWLRALVLEEFPALGKAGKWGDPWEALCLRLVRLGLFTPVEEETTAHRLVRVHRLVQELLLRELPGDERQERQKRINPLVKSRAAALEQTTNWQEACWELEPLDALAWLWDESEHQWRSWLMNLTGVLWQHVAEWPPAEPLMRRALAIDEHSFGTDHPEVAIRLNNLALLLQATNRLADAEPLMRRMVVIFIQFQLRTGHPHPHLEAARGNYAGLLSAMGRSAEEIQQQLEEVAAEARRGLAES